MGLIKTLIHVHTNYSFDSSTAPEALARFAERENIGCIAVTDHDTIEGAKHLAAITDAKVIIGSEITTREGDLIGLFLERPIDPGMSARDTARAIREQGGLVLLPHPFIKLFGCGLGKTAWRIADLIDAVEVCNAQNIVAIPDRKADRFADRLGLAKFVGSDSHVDASIAPCYQLMGDFTTPADFLDALRAAEPKPGRHPLWYFAAAAYRIVLAATGLPLPPGFGANHQPITESDPVLAPVGIEQA